MTDNHVVQRARGEMHADQRRVREHDNAQSARTGHSLVLAHIGLGAAANTKSWSTKE